MDKTCIKCGYSGPYNHFKTGANICKECRRAYMAEYRRKNKTRINRQINCWRRQKKERESNILNILVIDDDKTVYELLLKHFTRHINEYFTMDWASDGFEGGKKLADIKPQLIFLDLMMPGIDGFQVCKNIREDTNLQTRIIALTGYYSEVNERKIMKAGADLCIPKPLDLSRLLELARYLSIHPGHNKIINKHKLLIQSIIKEVSSEFHMDATIISKVLEAKSLRFFDPLVCLDLKRYEDEDSKERIINRMRQAILHELRMSLASPNRRISEKRRLTMASDTACI